MLVQARDATQPRGYRTTAEYMTTAGYMTILTTHTHYLNIARKSLEYNGNIILKCFAENCLKANTGKCHLNVSKVNKGLSIKINNDTIDCSSQQKLLVVIIDNGLKFENHVKSYVKNKIKNLWRYTELHHV